MKKMVIISLSHTHMHIHIPVHMADCCFKSLSRAFGWGLAGLVGFYPLKHMHLITYSAILLPKCTLPSRTCNWISPGGLDSLLSTERTLTGSLLNFKYILDPENYCKTPMTLFPSWIFENYIYFKAFIYFKVCWFHGRIQKRDLMCLCELQA